MCANGDVLATSDYIWIVFRCFGPHEAAPLSRRNRKSSAVASTHVCFFQFILSLSSPPLPLLLPLLLPLPPSVPPSLRPSLPPSLPSSLPPSLFSRVATPFFPCVSQLHAE